VWSSARAALAWCTLDRLMVGVMLVLIFAAAACTGMQSDSWWQLRAGQWIVYTRQVWLVDPFSSTAQGAPWPNHEWLTQVLFYLIYLVAGLRGVVVLCAMIATATWWIIYQLCVGAPRYRAITLLLAVVCHEIVWAVRPHMVSLLLVALTILLIQRRRFHWILPPLFLLWANLHGGVVLGGVVLLVATGTALFVQPREVRYWAGLTALCALATLINPMGLGLWRFALSMFSHPETEYIQEWLPPSLDWPISYPFFMLAAFWLLIVGLRWRQWRGFDDWMFVLLGFTLLLLGFRAVRHTPLFAIAALPLIARVLPAETNTPAPGGAARRGALHLAFGGLIGLSCVALVGYSWNDRRWMAWEPLSPAVIDALRGCPGPLYNTYDTGGALLWFVPEQAVFVDSRNDPYPLDLLFRAVITEQQGTYHELFQKYDVSCALVPLDKPIYTALRHDLAWQEVAQDAEVAVLYRSTADPASMR
jgi:hypothetical protein